MADDHIGHSAKRFSLGFIAAEVSGHYLNGACGHPIATSRAIIPLKPSLSVVADDHIGHSAKRFSVGFIAAEVSGHYLNGACGHPSATSRAIIPLKPRANISTPM